MMITSWIGVDLSVQLTTRPEVVFDLVVSKFGSDVQSCAAFIGLSGDVTSIRYQPL